MVLDHAIPTSICVSLSVPSKWRWDFSNAVLACATCNGFRNRYEAPDNIVRPVTLEAFYDLRDKIFVERKKRILERHERELRFFNERPWDSQVIETISEGTEQDLGGSLSER